MKKTYMKYFKAFALVGMMTTFVVFTSCSDDEGAAGPTQTVWEIIEGTSNLSSLESEFSAFEDIVTTLSNENANLTVFAPSDQALSVLLGTLGLTDFSSVSPSIAEQVLEYHIVTSAAIASGDLSGTVMTSQGELITVTSTGTLSTGATSESAIQTSDIAASNGTIHIVDVVLVPPTIGAQIVATLGTLAQPIFLGADFTTLTAAINKADATATDPTATITALLVGDGSGVPQVTVFAPTNATFEAGEITLDTYDAATWNAIIRNHVVIGQGGTDDSESIPESELTSGASFTTALGSTLLFLNSGTAVNVPGGPGIFIDSSGDLDLLDPTTYGNAEAEVALIDAATAQNGRIHVIAGVLAPPQ